METRTYHGKITPDDFARGLIAYFNRGNFRVQQVGSGAQVTIQIATSAMSPSGGQTALSISLQAVEDGVSIQIGQQAWLGVAASLGWTAIAALQNPFSLLGRLDDLAQDIESMQLTQDIWKVINDTAHALNAGFELSERLRKTVCSYCNTANPPGEAHCIGCGAPLGDVQPETCPKCGFVLNRTEKFCPNCGQPIAR